MHTHTHTHTHTHRGHTPGAVGSHFCCGAQGAVGGSLPCSRAPQLWYWGWRQCWLFTPPTYNPCQTWDSNPQPLDYKSDSLTIRPRLPVNGYCSPYLTYWRGLFSPLPSPSDSMFSRVARLRTHNKNERKWQWKAASLKACCNACYKALRPVTPITISMKITILVSTPVDNIVCLF